MIRSGHGGRHRLGAAVRGLLFGATFGLMGLGGCDTTEPRMPDPEWQGLEVGDPVPGLTPAELARFREGAALFRRIFSPEEGLGPLFNENACNACHTDPGDGGTGDQFMVRATRYTAEEGCDLLLDQGGDNVRQQATPLLRAHGITGDDIPEGATGVGRFNVPFLFGLGLVEAISDETILAREDPDDATGDGISGRAARDAQGRVARFGRKGHVTTIHGFIDEALRLEMGLTTPLHPDEFGPNRGPLPAGTDPTPNPEVDSETVELLTDFVRFLAPLSRQVSADPQQRAMAERGERLFDEIGCTGCHVPYMETGSHPIEALNRKRVHLYSDLLLHDMGEGLADVCGPSARPSEVRTEMLMGLGRRDVFLHDSRAVAVWEAIEHHGGEAAAARARFEALDRLQQEALVQFLYTL